MQQLTLTVEVPWVGKALNELQFQDEAFHVAAANFFLRKRPVYRSLSSWVTAEDGKNRRGWHLCSVAPSVAMVEQHADACQMQGLV